MTNYIPEKLYRLITKVIPIASTDIVVLRKGQVLLLKRNINPLKGFWALPGGHIELGETPKQAAMRELREETGIAVAQNDLLGEKVVTYFHPNRQDVTVAYITKISDFSIVLNEEHDEYIWVESSNLITITPISPVTIEEIKWAFKNEEITS